MQISVSHDVFELAQAFTISRGSRTEARVLTVRARDGTITGWGECVPYARYGETPDSVAAEIAGLDRTDFLLALARLGKDSFAVDFEDLDCELARG